MKRFLFAGMTVVLMATGAWSQKMVQDNMRAFGVPAKVPTTISSFTFTAAMDTAGTVRSKIRNDTLFTPWCYIGDVYRLLVAVQRIPYPIGGYKDTAWSTNVNDTTKVALQFAYAPDYGPGYDRSDSTNIFASKRPVRYFPLDSSLTNSAVIDTVLQNVANNWGKIRRDSVCIFPDYVRGMVVVHDSTKTTIASSGLVGNLYARQFMFYFNGINYK